jgi:hypothetical protein
MKPIAIFESVKESRRIEENYKQSVETLRKEAILQTWLEIFEFLEYVHTQGYRKRLTGGSIFFAAEKMGKERENLIRAIHGAGYHGFSLNFSDGCHDCLAVKHDDLGIKIITGSASGTYYRSVEEFCRIASQLVLDEYEISNDTRSMDEVAKDFFRMG